MSSSRCARSIGNEGKDEVEEPAAADVWPASAAVAEDALVLAPGVLEGVAQDRHLVPGAFVVDRLGELANRAVVPREPERVDVRRLDEVVGDFVE